MQAAYLGYADGPSAVRHAGILFRKGVFVNVTDEVATRLSTNRFFKVEEGEAPEAPAEEPELNADPGADPFDRDGDGEPGGSNASAEKDEVIAKLEALQAKHPEVEFDRRWGLARLRGVLEAAEFEHGDG